jgi:hypothetical protein
VTARCRSGCRSYARPIGGSRTSAKDTIGHEMAVVKNQGERFFAATCRASRTSVITGCRERRLLRLVLKNGSRRARRRHQLHPLRALDSHHRTRDQAVQPAPTERALEFQAGRAFGLRSDAQVSGESIYQPEAPASGEGEHPRHGSPTRGASGYQDACSPSLNASGFQWTGAAFYRLLVCWNSLPFKLMAPGPP